MQGLTLCLLEPLVNGMAWPHLNRCVPRTNCHVRTDDYVRIAVS